MRKYLVVFLMFAVTTWSETPTREAIAQYLDSCIQANQIADMVGTFGTDYRGLDLSGLPLKGVHAIRMNTRLAGADFTGANLQGTEFGSADLAQATFVDADLTDAFFVTADLSGADFTGATLDGCIFQECFLRQANLTGADLSTGEINSSDFPMAKLSGAILSGAATQYAGFDFTGADLRKADLSSLDLRRSDFSGADCTGANFTDTDLGEAVFTDADLTGAVLEGIQAEHADFRSAKGLDEDRQAALVGAAGRTSFEIMSHLRRALEDVFLPTWLILLIAIAILSVKAFKRQGAQLPFILAQVPVVVSYTMVIVLLIVMGSGGSATAQLNAGFGWTLWFYAWPIYMVLTFVSGPLSVLALILALCRKTWRNTWNLVISLMSVANVACTVKLLTTFFPDA